MSNNWITKRCNRTGRSINPNPRRQRKGPLRRIIEVVRQGTGMFDRDRVKLECGHTVLSNGSQKARCLKCAEAQQLASSDQTKP